MVRVRRSLWLGLVGILMVWLLVVMADLTKGIDLWPLLTSAVAGTVLFPLFGPETHIFWMGALLLAFILALRFMGAPRLRAAGDHQQQPLVYVSPRLQRLFGAVVTGLGVALFFGMLTLGLGPWLIAGTALMGIGLPLAIVSERRLLLGAVMVGLGIGIFLGLLTMGVGPWLIGGLGALFTGLALLLAALIPAVEAA